jgi:hypothetical protein
MRRRYVFSGEGCRCDAPACVSDCGCKVVLQRESEHGMQPSGSEIARERLDCASST